MDVWPWIFNVADTALVIGVALLMLTSIVERRPAPAGSPAASVPAA
jgi:lipoprotein signal peptidase